MLKTRENTAFVTRRGIFFFFFFRLNHLTKIPKKCSQSILSSQAKTLDYLDQNLASCYVHISQLLWVTALPVFTPVTERGEKEF